MLLSRDNFREQIFARDKACVVCGASAQDAHHLIERRLWADGGYYLDNGVALCPGCHMLAEQTVLLPQRLRDLAGIERVHLPEDFDDEGEYDKWGNPIWPDGTRSPGPLFRDSSVQKVLRAGGVLDDFRHHYKHAQTLHLPWSPNRGNDGDGVHTDDSTLWGHEVVATLKMDGEQTTFYRDRYHARSIESAYHPSRTWVGNLWGNIAHEIPEGWRIIGENVYAEHSIAYRDLPTYFFVFGIFDDNNMCLSWSQTQEWAELLGLETVPTLYRGPYAEHLRELVPPPLWTPESEGYVIRWARAYSYYEWSKAVGKWVRKDHVKADRHWRHKPVTPNTLA